MVEITIDGIGTLRIRWCRDERIKDAATLEPAVRDYEYSSGRWRFRLAGRRSRPADATYSW